MPVRQLLPLFVAAAAIGLPSARAAEVQPPHATEQAETAEKRRWALEISPYGWATGLRADVSPYRHGPVIEVDKSFSDVMEDLRFAGFLDIWARYDRFVLSADFMYVDIEEAHAIGALPKIGTTPGLKGSVNSTQFVGTLQAGYRVYDSTAATLDLTAGLRWWGLSNTATIAYDAFSISYSTSSHWIDPVIGARAFYNLTDKISLMAQGDIGGFSAGSRLTWQVLGTVNYVFTDHLSASVGYKALWVDHDSDGHVYKGRYSGPVLGVTYRF